MLDEREELRETTSRAPSLFLSSIVEHHFHAVGFRIVICSVRFACGLLRLFRYSVTVHLMNAHNIRKSPFEHAVFEVHRVALIGTLTLSRVLCITPQAANREIPDRHRKAAGSIDFIAGVVNSSAQDSPAPVSGSGGLYNACPAIYTTADLFIGNVHSLVRGVAVIRPGGNGRAIQYARTSRVQAYAVPGTSVRYFRAPSLCL